MEFLLLCALFSYRNARIAKRKGQNIFVWCIITAAALFIGMMIGMMVVYGLFYKGPMEPMAIAEFMTKNLLRVLTIYAFGGGGCLLVGYILERMPDINNSNKIR